MPLYSSCCSGFWLFCQPCWNCGQFVLWKASISSRQLGCPPRHNCLWSSSLSAFRRWKMYSTTGRYTELSPKIRRSCCLSSMTTSRRRRSLPRVQMQECILHQVAQAKRYCLGQGSILVLCSLWCCRNAEEESRLIFKPTCGAWPVSYYTLMLQSSVSINIQRIRERKNCSVTAAWVERRVWSMSGETRFF